MRILCPNCNSLIENENINVSENICVCKSCGQLLKLSEMLDQEKLEETENLLRNPPKDINIKKESGQEIITISAKSRSAVILLVFALITSAFIGFIASLVLAQGIFIIILFLAPFIIAIIALWVQAFFLMFGKIELVINQKEPAYLFKGIGKIGKKYFIDLPSVKSISEIVIKNNYADDTYKGRRPGVRSTTSYLQIEGIKLQKIPTDGLKKENIEFLVNVLKYYKERKQRFQQFN